MINKQRGQWCCLVFLIVSILILAAGIAILHVADDKDDNHVKEVGTAVLTVGIIFSGLCLLALVIIVAIICN